MNESYYFLTNSLTEDETRIITSIVNHIEKRKDRASITQIANENFVSTSFIIKMCKRLGFNGYSELFYSLSQKVSERMKEQCTYELSTLIDDYSEADVQKLCDYLHTFRDRKLFVVGEGFADLVADYFVQRLGVSGFMVFNRVHFYDYMLFREGNRKLVQSNVEPSLIFAISQSGETTSVTDDVVRAKQNGFKVVSFTKRVDSALAGLSDLVFVVDGARQTLISGVPNPFFGKVILAFEEILGIYFQD
jgi:DNA-binding MurR/RpiR family transcriptional regulator